MNTPSRRQILASASLLLAARGALARRIEQLAEEGAAPPRRSDYLLAEEVTYLNHGSVGTVPRAVHEAHVGYLGVCESNPWLYVWGGAWAEALQRVHALAALMLGTEEAQVAVIRNATAAFGMAANGLPLGEGDEVLHSSLNHVGASASWRDAAEARGFSVREFAFPTDAVAALSTADVTQLYVDAIQDKTRVLILPHIDNIFGLRHDVAEIARRARERGVQWILVDGAQSVGMHPVKVNELGVDLYATSSHKWLQAPKGTGLMVLSKAAMKAMRPLVTSWGHERWKETARAFTDFGTRDIAKILTVGDAIALHRASDKGREDRLRELRTALAERVASDPRFEWRSPASYDSGGASLVAVGLREGSAKAASKQLFEKSGIVVRGFEGNGLNHLRVSPNALNTEAEIDAFWRGAQSL